MAPRVAVQAPIATALPGAPARAPPKVLAVVPAAVLALAAPPAARAVQTVELTLAGKSVAVDLYPSAQPARGAVILAHGFTRSRTTLGGHAQALAGEGVLALTPDMPNTFDFRLNALGIAELVAWVRAGSGGGAPLARVVLVGFSAGALSSLLAAATPGVVGYVGLDPFDRTLPGGGALGLDFAPGLRTEAVLLRAPPSICNAQGVAAPWARALPALVSDRVLDGASHCDFESPTDWMCRLACGDTDPARQAIVRATLIDAVDRWLPRGVAGGEAGRRAQWP